MPGTSYRPVGRPPKRPQLNIFCGHPAKLLAERCAVAHSTADAYETGRRRPNNPAPKFFLLQRDRRILTPERRDWPVTPNSIVDPEGTETSRAFLQTIQ